MKPLVLASVLASCFLGSAFGSWLALRPQVTAAAQIRGSVGLNPAPPRTDDKLTIPDDGLPIVNNRNALLGRFIPTSNGLNLVFYSSAGQPGLSLECGPGGMVTVGSTADRAGISIVSSRGMGAATLVQGERAVSTLGAGERRFQVQVGSESSLSLPGRGTAPIFSVKSLPDGGVMSLSSREGRSLFDVTTNLEQAVMNLEAPKDRTKLTASGRGLLAIVKEGATAWSAPFGGASQASGSNGDGGGR